MTNKNKKTYLVVYGCEPNQGGEHEVGWKIANELVDRYNLTVLTRKSNQKLIEQYNDKKINFHFIENDTFIRFKPRGEFSYLYYLFWQLSAYLHLKKYVSEDDIVHYLTFGNIHLPHFLFLLKSKLIIGPMGGGSSINIFLLRKVSFSEIIKSAIHHIINVTVKINPMYLWVFYKSKTIILRTEESKAIIPKIYHKKCIVFLETGINTQIIHNDTKLRKLEKIIMTSSFINSKNIDQVIDVFLELEQLTKNKLELTLVGDGHTKKNLEKKYLNKKNIIFRGQVAHEFIPNLLRESDLFLFCSVKEGGSHSIFEAAMNNLPIACYDVSGLKKFPKNNSAIKIAPSHDVNSNVKQLAEKIILTFKENKVEQICENAIHDLRENYDWQKITKKYIDIYNEVNN